MNIEELIRDLARGGPGPAADDRRAEEAFAEACRRADEDPREKQRIRDINDLVDAQDAVYDQALAAVDRGDLAAAEPLLRSSAEAGIGDSEWLLATVLEQCGHDQEALLWYRRAAADGDPRADDKIAELNARPAPADTDCGAGKCFAASRAAIKAVPGPGVSAMLDVLAGCTGPDLPAALDVLASSPVLMNGALEGISRLSASAAMHWRRNLAVHYAWTVPELPRMDDWILRSALVLPAMEAMLSACPTALIPQAASHAALDAAFWADCAKLLAPGAPGAGKTSLARVVAAGACRPSVSRRPRAVLPELTAAGMMLPLASVPATAPGATLREATEQVLKSGVQALPVTEDADAVRVVGVVTLADLALAMHQARGVPSIERVEALMRPPVTVPSDMPASAVMATAVQSQAGLLVVTGPDDTPVGYLTPGSILATTPAAGRDRESRRASRSLLLLPELIEATTR